MIILSAKNIFYNLSFLIFFLNLFAHSSLQAQCEALEDSLRKTKVDTSRAILLNELSWCHSTNNTQKALNYGNKALVLAQKAGFKREEAVAYVRMARVYQYQKENDKALEYTQKALEIEQNIRNSYGIARATNQIALIHLSNGNYLKSIVYLEEALPIFQALKNKVAEATVQENLGICYLEIGDRTRSLKYLQKGLQLRENLGDSLELSRSYTNLGRFYERTKNYQKALSFYKIAEKILKKSQDLRSLSITYFNLGVTYQSLRDYEKSLEYLHKCLDMDTTHRFYEHLAVLYNTLGITYKNKGQEKEAFLYYQKSLQTAKELKSQDTNLLMMVYNNLGELEKTQGHMKEALTYFEESEKLTQTTQKKLIKLTILHNLADIYTELGDYQKAALINQQADTLRDNLESSFREAMHLKDEYEAQKQEEAVQKAELAQLKAERQQQNTLITALVITIGLLGFALWAVYRSFQKQKEAKEAQLQALEKDKQAQDASLKALKHQMQAEEAMKKLKANEERIDKLLEEQGYASMNAMLKGQEEERNRIALDLHDRVGSVLSMVKLNFDSLKNQIDQMETRSTEQYTRATELLNRAYEEVRQVSHAMASGVLRKFGLVSALEDLKNVVEASEAILIDLVFTNFEGKRLKSEIEVNLYRIIQELISNTLKHAEASEIEIQLFWKTTLLNIIYDDNGKGFNPDDINPQSGMGLYTIQSRVKGLKGTLQIDSKESRGTTFIIDIPL